MVVKLLILFNMFDLKKKIIVITGGNGLLGDIIAKTVKENNGVPIILDIKNKRTKNKFFKVDITSEEEVKKASQEILKKYKSVYALINNAANNEPFRKINNTKVDNFEKFNLERWHKDLNVGLTGAFLCSKYFGPLILRNKKGGTIINISSDLGLIAPYQKLYEIKKKNKIIRNKKPISYSVVKSGLIGLTKYLSTYWSDKNIRCNCICPGGIMTNQKKDFQNKLKRLIPLKRMANKNDYKSTILWMLSEKTEYLNGSIIAVDGGRTAW